jgi:RNA polymerase sigma-70 factor (ECF subfamily)
MDNGSTDFEEMILPHLDSAYNLARWIMRDPQDAEDVVQEAYLRALRYFAGFQGENGRSWLLRIVRNSCYSWLQKNRSREFAMELDESLVDSNASDPEAKMIATIERRMLRSEIENLPTPFKEIVVLRDIEGLSYAEIAEVTDTPVGTVMSRLARGRARLHKCINAQLNGGRI